MRLNDKLWNGWKLKPEVERQLLDIAADFQAEFDIPDEAIVDIIITGSMANFNWTSYSDIDLHLVVDFGKVDDNLALLSDYYKAIKSLWNDAHEITICDHEVEIYVQDVHEEHMATGQYSLQDSKWLVKPDQKAEPVKPAHSKVIRKAGKYRDRIEKADSYEEAQQIKDDIKQMRQTGLRDVGEYSIENLTFKELRNAGHLDILSDKIDRFYDDQHSLDCPE